MSLRLFLATAALSFLVSSELQAADTPLVDGWGALKFGMNYGDYLDSLPNPVDNVVMIDGVRFEYQVQFDFDIPEDSNAESQDPQTYERQHKKLDRISLEATSPTGTGIYAGRMKKCPNGQFQQLLQSKYGTPFHSDESGADYQRKHEIFWGTPKRFVQLTWISTGPECYLYISYSDLTVKYVPPAPKVPQGSL